MELFGKTHSNKARKKPKLYVYALVFLFLVFLDQSVKAAVQKPFLNDKFAFSLPLPVWLIFVLYAVILSLIFVYCYKKYRVFNTLEAWAWILVIAGAVSNVGERIVLGFVRDYLFIFTGVFNLADGYIILGMVLLLFSAKISPRSIKEG